MEAAAAAATAKEEQAAAAALFKARGAAAQARRRRNDALKAAMAALIIVPTWSDEEIVREVLHLAWGASKKHVWQLSEEERAMLLDHITKYRTSTATKPVAGEAAEEPSLIPEDKADDGKPPKTIESLYAETLNPSPAQTLPALSPERHSAPSEEAEETSVDVDTTAIKPRADARKAVKHLALSWAIGLETFV